MARKADRGATGPAIWKLEEARARFPDLVRLARREGPQSILHRGRRAVVVMDADEYDRVAAPPPKTPLVPFLERLHMPGVDLSRPSDRGEGR